MKLSILLISIITFTYLTYGQDPIFNNLESSPTYINPAFTGYTPVPRVNFNFQHYQAKAKLGYINMYAAVDDYKEKYNSGFGASYSLKRSIYHNSNTFHILYSYRYVKDSFLSIKFGTELGLIKDTYKWQEITQGTTHFYNGILPSANFDKNTSYSSFDFSLGGIVTYKRYDGGFSLHHLNVPTFELHNGVYASYFGKITFFSRYRIGDEDKVSLTPYILYQTQGHTKQYQYKMYGQYYQLLAGIGYVFIDAPNINAFHFMIGYKEKQIEASYSFDLYNVLNPNTPSTKVGFHEIGIILYIRHVNINFPRSKY